MSENPTEVYKATEITLGCQVVKRGLLESPECDEFRTLFPEYKSGRLLELSFPDPFYERRDTTNTILFYTLVNMKIAVLELDDLKNLKSSIQLTCLNAGWSSNLNWKLIFKPSEDGVELYSFEFSHALLCDNGFTETFSSIKPDRSAFDHITVATLHSDAATFSKCP